MIHLGKLGSVEDISNLNSLYYSVMRLAGLKFKQIAVGLKVKIFEGVLIIIENRLSGFESISASFLALY